jgi:hypothetical protein
MGALVNDHPGPDVLVLTMRAVLQTSNTPVALVIKFFIFSRSKIVLDLLT